MHGVDNGVSKKLESLVWCTRTCALCQSDKGDMVNGGFLQSDVHSRASGKLHASWCFFLSLVTGAVEVRVPGPAGEETPTHDAA